jgi:flagellar basal body-associated protein FliL
MLIIKYLIIGTPIAKTYSNYNAMDKEITLEVSSQKRKKGIVIAIITIAVLVLLIVVLRGFIKSSVKKSEITTAYRRDGQYRKYT